VRQRLREWLYDGADKAAPCRTQVEVTACFAPLVRWVLAWWQGDSLALALDATAHGALVVALVISVLYRGNAIPIAWEILPANSPGAWMPAILALVQVLVSLSHGQEACEWPQPPVWRGETGLGAAVHGTHCRRRGHLVLARMSGEV
jgi:hypothetical protein